MTVIPGSIRVTGFIAPSDSTDVYATHEDTYGKGSFRPVADLTARDAIPADRRKTGMWVFTEDTNRVYQLEGGVTNSDWIEVSFGGGSTAHVTELTASGVSLVDDTDFVAVEAIPNLSEGAGYMVEVSTTTMVGLLTVILYQDIARLKVVYTLNTDLSDSTTYRSAEVFGFEPETVGTLYGTVFVSGVGIGETLDISIKTLGLEPSAIPAPLPSPYGAGIEDDGTGKPRVAITTASGLVLAGGKLYVAADSSAPVYPVMGVGGMAVTGAVDTTTTQSTITGKKLFAAVGSYPLAAAGPPTTGTYAVGHIICDVAQVFWVCSEAGTPGVWELFSHVYDEPVDAVSGLLTQGSTELLEIPVYGNTGTIQRLEVWGLVAAVAESYIPFRVRIYKNHYALGRDLVWQGNSATRQTFLSANLVASSVDMAVNDNNVADIDEAIVVYDTVSRYELGRIVARPAGQFTLDEALVDANTWNANSLVLVASAWTNVPFVNDEAAASARRKIYLQIRHDGVIGDAAVTYYVRTTVLNAGVLRPYVPEELPS